MWCFFNLFGVLIPIDERFKPDFAEHAPAGSTVPAADFDVADLQILNDYHCVILLTVVVTL
ncbi:hypothetical protein ACNKHV_10920 [Shigella flexneri]